MRKALALPFCGPLSLLMWGPLCWALGYNRSGQTGFLPSGCLQSRAGRRHKNHTCKVCLPTELHEVREELWAFHRGSYPGCRRCSEEGISFHPWWRPSASRPQAHGDQEWTRRTQQLGTWGLRVGGGVQPCTWKEAKGLEEKSGLDRMKMTGEPLPPPSSLLCPL